MTIRQIKKHLRASWNLHTPDSLAHLKMQISFPKKPSKILRLYFVGRYLLIAASILLVFISGLPNVFDTAFDKSTAVRADQDESKGNETNLIIDGLNNERVYHISIAGVSLNQQSQVDFLEIFNYIIQSSKSENLSESVGNDNSLVNALVVEIDTIDNKYSIRVTPNDLIFINSDNRNQVFYSIGSYKILIGLKK